MKTKPIGIRFDAEMLKKIKEKENLKSPQAVVNFFFKWYEQKHFPIAGNPVMERNAPIVKVNLDVLEDDKDAKKLLKGMVPQKNVPRETLPKKTVKPIISGTPLQDKTTGEDFKDLWKEEPPPAGLKGIDLRIWKEEQKEKQKNDE